MNIISLKELKGFEHIEGKGKTVTAITMIKETELILATLRQNYSNFDKKIDSLCKSHNSMILVWNAAEFHRFTPLAILLCPVEISVIACAPHLNFHLIAGGSNGQVFIYDLSSLSSSVSPNN